MDVPEILSPISPKKRHDSINHAKIMEKLKNKLLTVANSDPKRVFTPSQIALFQQRLLDAFPSFHLPTHPPYAAMIQNAVHELNKESRVSDEVAISEYIKRTYTGLPWAHKRYLSHHLQKLCDAGELLWDHSDGNYIPPGTRILGNWKTSPGKRKLKIKIKEDVVEEGVVDGEELAEVAYNEVGIQENENQPNVVKRGKRRRCSMVVDEGEDEVGEVVVVEGGNLEPVDNGTCIEDHDLVLTAQESMAERLAGCEGESDQKAEFENEVKFGFCPLEHDHCEVKSELESVVVSSTIVQRVGDVTIAALQSDDGNSGANLMIVPYEGAKESDIGSNVCCNTSVPLKLTSAVDDTFASGWNIENGVPGNMTTDAVLKGNGHDHSDNKLILVPFEGNIQNSAAVRPSKWFPRLTDVQIVCGLACQSLDPPKVHPKQKQKEKQIQEVYFRRRRSNVTQTKAKLLEEQQVLSFPASPVGGEGLETKKTVKLKGLAQSQQANMSHLHEDIAAEQLDSQKESRPTSPECIVMEDVENLSLTRWKELATQKVLLKAPSAPASSKTDTESHNDLAMSENFVQMTTSIEDGFTSTKRTEKEKQIKQQNMQLSSDYLTSDNLVVDDGAGPGAESFVSVKIDGKDSGELEIADPRIGCSLNDSMSESAVLKHLYQSQCQHSSLSLYKRAITCSSHFEHPVLQIHQLMGGEQALLTSNVLTDEDRFESSPSQNDEQTEDKEVEDVSEKFNVDFCHPDVAQKTLPVDIWQCQLMERKGCRSVSEAPLERPFELTRGLIMEETSSILRQNDQSKTLELETDDESDSLNIESSSSFTGPDKAPCDQHTKKEKLQLQLVTKSPLAEPLSQFRKYQTWDKKGLSQDETIVQDPVPPVVAFIKGEVPVSSQHLQQQSNESKKNRGRPQKSKKKAKKDAVTSQISQIQQVTTTQEEASSDSPLHLQAQESSRPVIKEYAAVPPQFDQDEQEQLSETVAHLHLLELEQNGRQLEVPEPETDQQLQIENKQLEQVYRLRLRKRKEAPSEDAVRSLYDLLEGSEKLSVAATSEHPPKLIKQVKKRGRGRPKKARSDSSTDKHSRLQSEQLIGDDLISSRQQKEETAEGSDVQSCAVDLHEGQPSELATYQHIQHHTKLRKREHLPTQNELCGEHLTSSSNLAHLHKMYQTRLTMRERLGNRSKTDKGEQSEPGVDTIEEASIMLHQVDEKGNLQEMTDDRISCPVSQLSAMAATEVNLHLAVQSSQQKMNQMYPPSTQRCTRRSASRSMIDPGSDIQHHMELPDLGQLGKLTHSSVSSVEESVGRKLEHMLHNLPHIESKASYNEEPQKLVKSDKEEQSEKAIESFGSASSMLYQVHGNEIQQEQTNGCICCPDSEESPMATTEGPVHMVNQPSRQWKVQKEPIRRRTRSMAARSKLDPGSVQNLHPELISGRNLVKHIPCHMHLDHDSPGHVKEHDQQCFPDIQHRESDCEPRDSATKLSDSQLHQEQAYTEYDEHGQQQGKSKRHVKPLKEKPARAPVTHVPLSSKDQLRSRMKH